MSTEQELHPYAAGIEKVIKALKPLGMHLISVDDARHREDSSEEYVNLTLTVGFFPNSRSNGMSPESPTR